MAFDEIVKSHNWIFIPQKRPIFFMRAQHVMSEHLLKVPWYGIPQHFYEPITASFVIPAYFMFASLITAPAFSTTLIYANSRREGVLYPY